MRLNLNVGIFNFNIDPALLNIVHKRVRAVPN
jgi:hypothetical protein